MNLKRGLFRSIVGVAAAAAVALAPATAFAAGGPPAGRGSGGGMGGGGGEETTVTNNLSVPAVFIGTVAGFGLTNPALQAPTGNPTYVSTISPAGYYYIQGQNKWQAAYELKSSDTATAKWGDNLTGSASLRAGHPIRVEMALTSTDVTSLQGYTVVKLNSSLADRLSPYGTAATANTDGTTGYHATPVAMPARVWVNGAELTIIGPSSTSTYALPGEINATGAVVFGYNWRPSEPGSYQLQFHVPEGSVTFSNPADTVTNVTVTSGAGGGSGGGGGHGTH